MAKITAHGETLYAKRAKGNVVFAITSKDGKPKRLLRRHLGSYSLFKRFKTETHAEAVEYVESFLGATDRLI